MNYRSYPAALVVNGLRIDEIKISDHYEKRHKSSISDALILKLVATLNSNRYEPESIDAEFQYFVNDHIEVGIKLYKLIWLIEKDCSYIGAVNAYRRG